MGLGLGVAVGWGFGVEVGRGCGVALGCVVGVAAGVAVASGEAVAVDPSVAVAVATSTIPELLLWETVVAVLCAVEVPPPSAPTSPVHEQQLQTIRERAAPTAMSTRATRGMLRKLAHGDVLG